MLLVGALGGIIRTVFMESHLPPWLGTVRQHGEAERCWELCPGHDVLGMIRTLVALCSGPDKRAIMSTSQNVRESDARIYPS